MQSIELDNDTWHLTLLPEWGGRIGSLRVGDLDILLPINTSTFDPLNWPRGGAYPLLPYSNRLRDARLNFEDREYKLPAHPAAQPHTLHGVSHTLEWTVNSLDAKHAVLVCEYHGEHWPWPIRAEQHFSLIGERLRIRLCLTNLGDHAMPGGLGLHPYFQRHSGMQATLQAQRNWLIDDAYLPTGQSRVMNTALSIDASAVTNLAYYLSQWDGALSLNYPQGRLLVQAEAPLSHFVAFAPVDAAYLCLEPVSHLADAFNTPANQWPEVGTQRIEPGQRLEATLELAWRPGA